MSLWILAWLNLVFQGPEGDIGGWINQDTDDAHGLSLPSYMGMVRSTPKQPRSNINGYGSPNYCDRHNEKVGNAENY